MDRNKLSRSLFNLYGLLSKLRGPDGCPWDARQTDSSVKMYLLEEAYEVLDAVESGLPEDICQELGDLLFQILFLTKLAEERGEFGLVDVMEKITKKMITRHPHVFGPEKVESPEEVAENWVKIKKTEKGSPGSISGQLQSVPVNLPALLRAHRLNERTSRMDVGRPGAEKIWDRIEDRFHDLGKTIIGRDKERFGKELGDLLFDLADLARHWGLNAEDLLRDANQNFIKHIKKTGLQTAKKRPS